MSFRTFNLVITVIGLVLSTQNAMALGGIEKDLGQPPSRQTTAFQGALNEDLFNDNNPTSGGGINYGGTSQSGFDQYSMDRLDYGALTWSQATASWLRPQRGYYADTSLDGWQMGQIGPATRIGGVTGNIAYWGNYLYADYDAAITGSMGLGGSVDALVYDGLKNDVAGGPVWGSYVTGPYTVDGIVTSFELAEAQIHTTQSTIRPTGINPILALDQTR